MIESVGSLHWCVVRFRKADIVTFVAFDDCLSYLDILRLKITIIMKRPDYIRDADGRRNTDHAHLLEIADGVRLGNHQAASMLTPIQLDAMTDAIVSTTGEDRAQLARQHSVYIATRYSLARRSDGNATTIRKPSAAARAEQKARQDMITASRNASRPTRHTDHAPPANPREMERRARASMVRDSANAWRRSK